MAYISNYPLDFIEANKFADLEGIKQDLQWVVIAGKRYEGVTKTADFILCEALCAAIIIRYARVFMTGKRRRIRSELIQTLSPEDQKVHKYFIDLRSKFIAHSVNNFEENFCVAYIKDAQSNNPEFNQVSVHHSRIVSLGVLDINKIVALAKKLLEIITIQAALEKTKVTEMAKCISVRDIIKNRIGI